MVVLAITASTAVSKQAGNRADLSVTNYGSSFNGVEHLTI
jgi:hypothetical protein